MHRSVWPALLSGLAIFLPCVSASFGFTSANFQYVQLSAPQTISWNGQSGNIELRLMVYPADQELSYLPLAANLSGNSYTWMPTSLTSGSEWTLEAIDGDGNIAAYENPFTVQGTAASNTNTASTSLMQQDPQSPSQPTTLTTSAATGPAQTPTAAQTSSTSTSSTSSSTSTPPPSSLDNSLPTNIKIGIIVGVAMGLTGIVSLATFFILRYRQKRGKPLGWSLFRSRKRSSLPYELDGNDSMNSLSKPTELQGSDIEGTSETSWGSRMELGLNATSRQSLGTRISIAWGAVETSMGKRMELG